MYTPDNIVNKRLYQKASRLLEKMQYLMKGDLQFEVQDEEVRREWYAAIDQTKRFVDNIDYNYHRKEWKKRQEDGKRLIANQQ